MSKDPVTGVQSQEILHQQVAHANNALRGHLAVSAWPQAARQGKVEHFAVASDGCSIGLHEVLAKDKSRIALNLDFGDMAEVTDLDLSLLAQGLPPFLVDLSLSFGGCIKVSDAGVSALANRLGRLRLQRLRLDFVGCHRITDAGLESISESLPSTLSDLRLEFAYCTKLHAAGIQKLAQRLPVGVKHLKATFKGTHVNQDFDSVRNFKRFAPATQKGIRTSIIGANPLGNSKTSAPV
jgi:hypothetical protein